MSNESPLLRKRKHADSAPEGFDTLLSSQSTDDVSIQCDVCSQLLSLLRGQQSSNHERFGGFQEVMMSTRCDLHPKFFQACFNINLCEAGIGRFSADSNMGDCNINAWSEKMIAVSDPIHLIRSKDARNHNGFGILVDRSWIEDGILARWKSLCISQNCCPSFHPPTTSKESLFRPVWLFDTQDLRLVRGGRIKADYVALSYVWGTKPFFQTTKDHLARLLRPQSFLQLELLGVPRTIRDAIGVVNLLNERYLWVDALCIVQDDMHEKHSQINNMAAIFASAKITIIAKQGADANFGLKGLRGISQPRNLDQVKIMLEDGSVLIRGSRDGLSDPWSGRGWTFQEDYFSNRKIVFDQDSVAWECRCSKFREHLDTYPGAIQSRGISLKQNPKRLLLEDYNSLVAKYNFRTLTYPQDALAAFAGVTTALTKSFSGGFICGLPTLFIDQALCWEHKSGSLCERRVASGTLSGASYSSSLPSWSWLGWKCVLRPEASNNSGCDFLMPIRTDLGSVNQRTIPIVQWSSMPYRDGPATKVNDLHDFRLRYLVKNEDTLPEGWQRQRYQAPYQMEQYGYCPVEKVMPRHWYTHRSMQFQKFWYPIPLANASSEIIPRHSDPLLQCRTQKAWLTLNRKSLIHTNARIGERSLLLFALLDDSQAVIGALQPTRQLVDDIYTLEENKCELVAISRGFNWSPNSLGWNFMSIEIPGEDPRPVFGKYEYYNLLWIEWKDGIAYRKGLARVEKSAWESLDLEWIDLILG